MTGAAVDGVALATPKLVAEPHAAPTGLYPIPILSVIVLLVALRVADLIPWFVFAIVVWLWCFGRFHRPHRYVWHQSLRH